jgi:hypothetical protein
MASYLKETVSEYHSMVALNLGENLLILSSVFAAQIRYASIHGELPKL